MNNAVYYVLVIVAGYFCGCIESGYLALCFLCNLQTQSEYWQTSVWNRKQDRTESGS